MPRRTTGFRFLIGLGALASATLSSASTLPLSAVSAAGSPPISASPAPAGLQLVSEVNLSMSALELGQAQQPATEPLASAPDALALSAPLVAESSPVVPPMSLSDVPEPTSFLMLLMGLVPLYLAGRRRFRR